MKGTTQPSKALLWTGRVMSALPVLLITFGGVMKILKAPAVVQGTVQAGFPETLVRPVGIIEMLSVIVYLIPQTSVLGAILLTGTMGGAIAVDIRIGSPAWIPALVCGMLAWGGLFFRDVRLRALIPFRKSQ